jgi:hypothetical protein
MAQTHTCLLYRERIKIAIRISRQIPQIPGTNFARKNPAFFLLHLCHALPIALVNLARL